MSKINLDSKYYNISIDTHELIARLPDGVWTKIEEQLLKNAKEEYGVPFTGIDFIDQEGDKILFGVYE